MGNATTGVSLGWAEDDWERRTPYVPLSPEEGRELLVDFGVPTALQLLDGGKANTNYKATFEGRAPLVLRIYERDRDALQRESLLLEMVADVVPVPRLLARGRTAAETPVGIFEFIEGEHPSDVIAAGRAAGAIGETVGLTLAALSTFEYATPGLFAPDLSFERTFESTADSFVDLIEWSLREGRAGERLGPELRGQLSRCLDRAAERLEPLDAHYSLTHGDYKFSNILVVDTDDGWQLSGLLDWEFACAFTPLLDIANLLRHRDTFPPTFVTAFADAYSSRASLPGDWQELTRVLDLMNLVGFLNAAGERPRLFDDVRRLVAQTLELIR